MICLIVQSITYVWLSKIIRIFDLTNPWGISSAGRAPALHAGGHRFDPVILHHFMRLARKFLTHVLLVQFVKNISHNPHEIMWKRKSLIQVFMKIFELGFIVKSKVI